MFTLRELSYANGLDTALQSALIRSLEWMTGKVAILRMVRRFERRGGATGLAVWRVALEVMGIEADTPDEQIAHIPRTGPVVVVANHPHGLVDGMVLAEIIARVRADFGILTREFPSSLAEFVSPFVIPVPFPDDPDALAKGKAMRARAGDMLAAGGLVGVFPSGEVATSATPFGPVVEADWHVFTAQLIRKNGATVLPIYFPGRNSRLFQLANRVSPTLRRALLLREIARASNRNHRPVVGAPLSEMQMASLAGHPRRWIAWLRAHTLSLGD